MYDTVDKVERRGMREAAALAARLALRIASADAWPAQRRSQAAVQAVLDSPDHQEEQALYGQVRAYYAEKAL
jgi:hypothetical protein